MRPRSKIIVVVGPTASGKSELAVNLAKKFNGEILSVDSRQVYRGLNLGTGKVPGHLVAWHPEHVEGSGHPKQTKQAKRTKKVFMYQGIPHWGIDIASPRRQYSVAKFKLYANLVIAHILGRGKTPVLCGGTAHWLDAVVFDQSIPEVKPNLILRKQLSRKSKEELLRQLAKLDRARAKSIDPGNKRRLIRALEIVLTTGKPVPTISTHSPYASLWVGLRPDRKVLFTAIAKRLKARISAGILRETARLLKAGLPHKRLEDLGLEYRYCSRHLRKLLNAEEFYSQLLTEIQRYSKRQLTWWKRSPNIHWFTSPRDPKLKNQVRSFLATPSRTSTNS